MSYQMNCPIAVRIEHAKPIENPKWRPETESGHSPFHDAVLVQPPVLTAVRGTMADN